MILRMRVRINRETEGTKCVQGAFKVSWPPVTLVHLFHIQFMYIHKTYIQKNFYNFGVRKNILYLSNCKEKNLLFNIYKQKYILEKFFFFAKMTG